MVDTPRTKAALQTLLADNVAGDISAQDLRDMLVSQAVPVWMQKLDHRVSGETAHADDDYFSVDSSADYTEVDVSGTTTWTTQDGLLSVLYEDQTAGDAGCYVKPITSASAPMTIETRVRMENDDVNSHIAGLCFTDGATTVDDMVSIGLQLSATGYALTLTHGAITNFDTDFTILRASGLPTITGGLYLRLVWTATNTFAAAVSPDGVSWTAYGAAADTFIHVPTHFGIFATTYGATVPAVATFDCFKVYDADLSV